MTAATLMTGPGPGGLPGQFELAGALQQGSLAAATRVAYGDAASILGKPAFGPWSDGRPRVFRGSADQVRQARKFARSHVSAHPAADDVTLVTSELASNAVAHSASGRPGGLFLVGLALAGAAHVAVIVTDQGGLTGPQVRQAGAAGESGRGLAMVSELACLFLWLGDESMRSVLAVIGADCRRPCVTGPQRAGGQQPAAVPAMSRLAVPITDAAWREITSIANSSLRSRLSILNHPE
jgi:anti-sigma regulatory factor (Ser/Thr protein kinase)